MLNMALVVVWLSYRNHIRWSARAVQQKMYSPKHDWGGKSGSDEAFESGIASGRQPGTFLRCYSGFRNSLLWGIGSLKRAELKKKGVGVLFYRSMGEKICNTTFSFERNKIGIEKSSKPLQAVCPKEA